MNTSTPNQSWSCRNTEMIPDETSHVLCDPQAETISTPTPPQATGERKKTNLSGGIDKTVLTPVKSISDSTEEKKIVGGARDLSRTIKNR